jgi:hypothetical protein
MEEARTAGIPFRWVVVADAIDGANAALEAQRCAAKLLSRMGLTPAHGTWHRVRGAGHPRDLERGVAPGAGMALPLGRWGSAAALLETLVERRPTARAMAALLAHVARSLPREAPM